MELIICNVFECYDNATCLVYRADINTGGGGGTGNPLSVIKASLGWPAQRRLCTLMNIIR